MLAKGWGVTANVKNSGLILAQRIILLGLSLLFATSSARAQDWNLRFDGNNDAKGRAGVAVNSSGMIVIAGSVCGTLAPSCFNPVSSTYVGSAFVWELDPQDNTLWRHEVGNWATSELIATGVGVDSQGNAYLTGYTNNTDLNAPGAFVAAPWCGATCHDVFVAKFDAANGTLLYFTYLGPNYNYPPAGADRRLMPSIAVDSSGNAYVTGTTFDGFPTVNALQSFHGSTCPSCSDAFVVKVDPTGAVVYSTYLGGSANDAGAGIAVDSSGNAYATGVTYSSDYSTTGGVVQPGLMGGFDAFVTKLSPPGDALVYSTYLNGGSATSYAGYGIALDGTGNAYVTGSAGFQSVNTFKLNTDASALLYSALTPALSALLGPPQPAYPDQSTAIGINPEGEAWITYFYQDGGSFAAKALADGSWAFGNATAAPTVGMTIDNSAAVDQSITVDAAGNVYFSGYIPFSSGPTQTFLVRLSTTTAKAASSANPSSYGTPVTLTATVGPPSAAAPVSAASAPTPTGNVTFKDGTKILGTASLDASGTATLNLPPTKLTGGTHTILTVYNGDTNYFSRVARVIQTVTKAPTTTGLTSNPNPSNGGDTVTFTANVTTSAPATVTGKVSFMEGKVVLGSGTISGGVATFTTSALHAGTHSITAQYKGTGNLAVSTSPSVTQTVNGQPSNIGLVSSVNPSNYGDLVTFTATVSSAAAPTPTGTVTFSNGTKVLGTAALDGSGNASLSTTATTLSVGLHTITANYNGDVNYYVSSTNLAQTVNKAATATSLASSVNPSNLGDSVTFTAGVSSSAPGTITGTVSFYDGAKLLGKGTIGGGAATFTTNTLISGSHSIVAAYNSNGKFAGSTSSALTQTVN